MVGTPERSGFVISHRPQDTQIISTHAGKGPQYSTLASLVISIQTGLHPAVAIRHAGSVLRDPDAKIHLCQIRAT